MKRYCSVFGLPIRATLGRILAVLIASAVVQLLRFRSVLQEAQSAYEAVRDLPDLSPSFPLFEHLLDESRPGAFLACAFLLITLFLCLPGTGYSSRTGYTLKRLQVSEHTVFVLHAVYAALAYLLLLASQLAVVFVCAQAYRAAVPTELFSNQFLFLAFYRHDLLHALLPLEDLMLWIRNAVLLAAVSLVTAEFSYKQRRRSFGWTAVVLPLCCVWFFPTGLDDRYTVGVLIVAVLIVGAELIYTLTTPDEEVSEDASEASDQS
jgi:hypothetical protein